MLEAGAEAPRFSLPGVHGGELRQFGLADYLGEDVVVLCFYPADFGPHCDPDDCWLADVDLLTLQRNVTVLGLSADSAFSHREFASQYNLEFPLLSDGGGMVAEAYDVLHDHYEGHRRLPRRALFVLDDRGVVRYAWAADEPGDRPDLESVRAAIRSVQSDESALERYRVGHDYYRYGRSEFDIAVSAYEDGDWGLAREAFAEATRYLEDATGEFGSARWFAASDDLADRIAAAKAPTDYLLQAARWYRESAAHFADGDADRGEDYRGDAARQRDRAEEAASPADPDDLAAVVDGDDD